MKNCSNSLLTGKSYLYDKDDDHDDDDEAHSYFKKKKNKSHIPRLKAAATT